MSKTSKIDACERLPSTDNQWVVFHLHPLFLTSISRPLWLFGGTGVYVTDQIHVTSIEGLLATSLTGYVYIYFVLAVLNFEL